MADARGTAYQARVGALVSLYGEALTLNRAGTDLARTAFISPIGDQYINTFYDANEAVGLLRPTLTLYLGGSADPPVAGDVFTRDDRLFTIRKTYLFRVVDVVVVTVALAD